MSVSEAWEGIENWISAYAHGSAFALYLAIAAAIYLLIANKDVRHCFIIPILAFCPIVINPLLYKYVYSDLRYWRFFWLLPETVLIGFAFADLSRRISRQWEKLLSLVLFVGVIALTGNNVFLLEENRFSPTDNYSKVDKRVRVICDIILDDNSHPKCIFDYNISYQSRIYAPEIVQLYGRDTNGYIIKPSQDAMNVYFWFKGDINEMNHVFELGERDQYTHICCFTREGIEAIAQKYNYELLAQAEGFDIYRWKLQTQ